MLWNETNHEVLLVNSKEKVMSFLARDIKLLRRHIHPQLLQFLEQKGETVGEDIHKSTANFHVILSALTGVHREAHEASQLLPGGFCLTADGLLKLLAIYVRVQSGIPVVLQGECGSGKTHMLRYLCAWLGADLRVLDVHGGTGPEDIIGIFKEATEVLSEQVDKVLFSWMKSTHVLTWT